jgi:hypothetical protein
MKLLELFFTVILNQSLVKFFFKEKAKQRKIMMFQSFQSSESIMAIEEKSLSKAGKTGQI